MDMAVVSWRGHHQPQKVINIPLVMQENCRKAFHFIHRFEVRKEQSEIYAGGRFACLGWKVSTRMMASHREREVPPAAGVAVITPRLTA